MLLPCTLLLRAGQENSPATPSVDDHGTFVLSASGRKFGTEKFSIRSSQDKIEAEAEIQLSESDSGHTASIQTYPKLVLDRNLIPQTYLWSTKGPQQYNLVVDFTGDIAKSQLHRPDGKDDIREFNLPKDVVVLDNNVIHHYQLLAGRFFQASGGKQAFQAYIPQDAVPGLVTVQDAGMESIDFRGKPETFRHLVVLTDNAEIDMWLDAQNHLQRLLFPSAKGEAVRQP